ncbi:hypothetical protein [Paenibacillus sp. LjRoot153]|uniref:hypothetical protein n=1 Tax=Paenibacillus sp. LjRoot153 TaxID=3342270 RepID=UPI003F4F81E0
MYFRMIALLLVSVTCLTVIFGCTNNDSQSEGTVVKEEKTVGNENNIEKLVLSNEIKKVTATQLRKITKKMTNKEVVKALGNSKDIGSGLYILRYEYENGKFLDFRFGHYDEIISEQSYLDIQNMLNGN